MLYQFSLLPLAVQYKHGRYERVKSRSEATLDSFVSRPELIECIYRPKLLNFFRLFCTFFIDNNRELERSVKAFDDLFKPAVFGRYGIIIGKAYDLDQVEIHALKGELLLSEFVGGIAVGNKFESHVGEFFELGKGRSHGKDTWTDITGVGYLIPKDRFLQGIHDEPDIVPDTFDFGVGFVSSKIVGGFVVIGIDERLHKSRSCLCVIGNRDMRNFDSVNFLDGSGSDSGGKAQVDIVS